MLWVSRLSGTSIKKTIYLMSLRVSRSCSYLHAGLNWQAKKWGINQVSVPPREPPPVRPAPAGGGGGARGGTWSSKNPWVKGGGAVSLFVGHPGASRGGAARPGTGPALRTPLAPSRRQTVGRPGGTCGHLCRGAGERASLLSLGRPGRGRPWNGGARGPAVGARRGPGLRSRGPLRSPTAQRAPKHLPPGHGWSAGAAYPGTPPWEGVGGVPCLARVPQNRAATRGGGSPGACQQGGAVGDLTCETSIGPGFGGAVVVFPRVVVPSPLGPAPAPFTGCTQFSLLPFPPRPRARGLRFRAAVLSPVAETGPGGVAPPSPPVGVVPPPGFGRFPGRSGQSGFLAVVGPARLSWGGPRPSPPPLLSLGMPAPPRPAPSLPVLIGPRGRRGRPFVVGGGGSPGPPTIAPRFPSVARPRVGPKGGAPRVAPSSPPLIVSLSPPPPRPFNSHHFGRAPGRRREWVCRSAPGGCGQPFPRRVLVGGGAGVANPGAPRGALASLPLLKGGPPASPRPPGVSPSRCRFGGPPATTSASGFGGCPGGTPNPSPARFRSVAARRRRRFFGRRRRCTPPPPAPGSVGSPTWRTTKLYGGGYQPPPSVQPFPFSPRVVARGGRGPPGAGSRCASGPLAGS